VAEVVAQQMAAGVDIVSDGEMSLPSCATYVKHRVDGIGMDAAAAEGANRCRRVTRSGRVGAEYDAVYAAFSNATPATARLEPGARWVNS